MDRENQARSVEKTALTTYDALSSNWGHRYYEGEIGDDMDVYDLRLRHRIAIGFSQSLSPINSAIEIGCGTGDNIAGIRADHRTGIDIAPGMVETARKRHPEIEFHHADLRTWESSAKQDLVLCLGVIQYVDDPEPLIAAAARMTAPGGALILSFPNSRSLFRRLTYRIYGRPTSQNDYSRKSVEAMLARHGFTPEQGKAHSFAFHRTAERFAPLNMRLNLLLAAIYKTFRWRWMADFLAYSYVGLYRKRQEGGAV